MTYTITSPIQDFDGMSSFSDVTFQFKEGVATTDAELAPGLLAYLERRGYTVASDEDEDLLGVGDPEEVQGDGGDKTGGQAPQGANPPEAPPAPPQEAVKPANHAEADKLAEERGLELTEEWKKLTVKQKTDALNASAPVKTTEVQS